MNEHRHENGIHMISQPGLERLWNDPFDLGLIGLTGVLAMEFRAPGDFGVFRSREDDAQIGEYSREVLKEFFIVERDQDSLLAAMKGLGENRANDAGSVGIKV